MLNDMRTTFQCWSGDPAAVTPIQDYFPETAAEKYAASPPRMKMWPEPAPDAVVLAVRELSVACSGWEPIPTDTSAMSEPPHTQSEHAMLCDTVLHGDSTMVALGLGAALGVALGVAVAPAIWALWRGAAWLLKRTFRSERRGT